MNLADRIARIGDWIDGVGALDASVLLLLLVAALTLATLLLLVMIWRWQQALKRCLPDDPAWREQLFSEMACVSHGMTKLKDDVVRLTELAGRNESLLRQQNSLVVPIEALAHAVRDLQSRPMVEPGDMPARRPPAHFSAEIAQIVRDLQNGPL